jgi:hypothetical protein
MSAIGIADQAPHDGLSRARYGDSPGSESVALDGQHPTPSLLTEPLIDLPG